MRPIYRRESRVGGSPGGHFKEGSVEGSQIPRGSFDYVGMDRLVPYARGGNDDRDTPTETGERKGKDGGNPVPYGRRRKCPWGQRHSFRGPQVGMKVFRLPLRLGDGSQSLFPSKSPHTRHVKVLRSPVFTTANQVTRRQNFRELKI